MANSLVYNPISGQFDYIGSGGSSATAKYTLDFVVADWVLAAPNYTLTILASTHGLGSNPNVQVFELNGSDYESVQTGISVNVSGDVVISVTQTPNNRFDGLILII